MRTLGIDLAAQPANTASCAIDWEFDRAVVSPPELDLTDGHLLGQIAKADKVGIDAPFGWPDEFVEAVAAHARLEAFPTTDRSILRYRAADRFVMDRVRRPLSVSSDRIAVPAMRCARLIAQVGDELEGVDRTGSGRLVEVYPAASLEAWGMDPKGYKRDHVARERLAEAITNVCPWLVLSEEARTRCVETDHGLDAFVSSLTARATALGLTHGPPQGMQHRSRREGWIHLPAEASLTRLIDARLPL